MINDKTKVVDIKYHMISNIRFYYLFGRNCGQGKGKFVKAKNER